MKDLQTSDPKAHSGNLRSKLLEIVEHWPGDKVKVKDPRAKALFETSAEVVNSLIVAFRHFEEGKEEAWK